MLSLIEFKADKNIENKVNFFSDYFKHLNKYLGRYSYLEFDNLLSLCEKVVFQIENNPGNRINYLRHHLKHRFFQKNGFTSQFKYFNKILLQVEDFLSIPKHKDQNKWIESNPQFLTNLKKLLIELNDKQFKIAVKFIINFLLCKHDLEYHKEDLKYLTQIIVSELRFDNKPSKKINDLIYDIMSKSERRFPLPKSILIQKEEDNYDEILSDFFENRNFIEQFEGIINFKEENKTIGYHLFRIFKLLLPKNKVIEYKNVEIRNPNDAIFDKFKDGKRKDYWNSFIEPNNISIAIVRGELNGSKEEKRKAINLIQRTINYINNVLQLNSYIDVYQYHSTAKFEINGFSISYDKANYELTDKDLNRINNDNPFLLLKFNKSKAAKRFLSAEKFYHRALISGDVSDYWHYLESIIPQKNENGQYKKQVKSVCAHILLIHYCKNFSKHIAESIFGNLYHDGLRSSLKRTKTHFSFQETKEIFNDFIPHIIYKKSNNFKNHPIITDLRSSYYNRSDKYRIKIEFDYFYSIFHELFEIRNAYVHGGITIKYAEKKIAVIIPRYIKIIRNSLLREITNYKSISMDKIIDKIVFKSKKYLD